MRRRVIAAAVEAERVRTPWHRPFAVAAVAVLLVIAGTIRSHQTVEPTIAAEDPFAMSAAAATPTAGSCSSQRLGARGSSGFSTKTCGCKSRCRDPVSGSPMRVTTIQSALVSTLVVLLGASPVFAQGTAQQPPPPRPAPSQARPPKRRPQRQPASRAAATTNARFSRRASASCWSSAISRA